MSSINTIKVEISEKDLIKVDISEKDIIKIDLKVIDILTKDYLADLGDVNIASPQDDDVLTYDSGEWVNKPSTGGLAGEGLSKDVNDYLNVNVDDITIEINISNNLQIKDLGITNEKIVEGTIGEEKLDINNAPILGYFMRWNGTKIEWADVDVIAVLDTDIKKENKSSECDGNNVTFTLSNTPVVNSVQVFLMGLLQEEGSGKDYTLSGTTITFAIAPEADDILIIHYIAQS